MPALCLIEQALKLEIQLLLETSRAESSSQVPQAVVQIHVQIRKRAQAPLLAAASRSSSSRSWVVSSPSALARRLCKMREPWVHGGTSTAECKSQPLALLVLFGVRYLPHILFV